MTDEYSTGQFGEISFTRDMDDYTHVLTIFHGTIKMIDKKYVLVADNNDTPYLIERKNFQFKACKFENKLL